MCVCVCVCARARACVCVCEHRSIQPVCPYFPEYVFYFFVAALHPFVSPIAPSTLSLGRRRRPRSNFISEAGAAALAGAVANLTALRELNLE